MRRKQKKIKLKICKIYQISYLCISIDTEYKIRNKKIGKMTHQRIISVNINTADVEKDLGYKEFEFSLLNDYLDEGYCVKDKITAVSNATGLFCINMTFILEKEITK